MDTATALTVSLLAGLACVVVVMTATALRWRS